MEITINNPSPLPYHPHVEPLRHSTSEHCQSQGLGLQDPFWANSSYKFRESNGTQIYQEEKSPPCLPVVVLEQDQLTGLTKMWHSPGPGAIISCELLCSVFAWGNNTPHSSRLYRGQPTCDKIYIYIYIYNNNTKNIK